MKPYMSLKTSIVLTALALLLPPQFAKAQGNLVLNGGFDTDASGWTIINGGYASDFGNPSGSASLFTGNTSMVSQEINSLTLGQLYIVSGDYSGKAGGVFDVTLDEVVFFETNRTPQNYSWDSFSFYYTATSTGVLLSVQANAIGDFYAIDNISMQAIPEPNSLCLVGVGGIMSAMFFRNRRKSSL